MSARRGKRKGDADARARANAGARAEAEAEATATAGADASEPDWGRAAFVALLGISVGMLGVRIYAASAVGFGDSEALYACWAALPQPAFQPRSMPW